MKYTIKCKLNNKYLSSLFSDSYKDCFASTEAKATKVYYYDSEAKAELIAKQLCKDLAIHQNALSIETFN